MISLDTGRNGLGGSGVGSIPFSLEPLTTTKTLRDMRRNMRAMDIFIAGGQDKKKPSKARSE